MKRNKVIAWIFAGLLAGSGLTYFGNDIFLSGDKITDAQLDSLGHVIDSLEEIAPWEVLVYNREDNPLEGGYKKGDCIRVLKRKRTARDMMETINPKFKLVRVMAMDIKEVEKYCEDDTTKSYRWRKYRFPTSLSEIIVPDSIALK